MKNSEIAKIFYAMADILEMKNIQWKPNAYRKAARSIEMLSEAIEDIYKRGGIKALEEIPGVGIHLATKIEEFLRIDKVKSYEEMKKSMPVNVEELMRVEGLGPKKIMLLYKKLRIRNIAELEKAAQAGKLRKISTLGEKTEANILKAIEFTKMSGKRKLLGVALPIARKIEGDLKKQKFIDKVIVCGSIARRLETIGDIDVLITTKFPKEAMDFFTTMKGANRIVAKGPTKSTIVYGNVEVDARVIDPESFGSATQYFIGSKDHNIALRRIAIKKGYKLSEYGLFKGNKKIAGKTEEEVYNKLGMTWMPPELRENHGEIEAAQKNKLPKLIELKDIVGDLQMHTTYSDAENTVEEMAQACKSLGYKYCAITDHVGTTGITNPMNLKRTLQQKKEIEKVNSKLKGFTVLQGAEVDIKLNGELAAESEQLKQYDVVLVAIHQGMKRDKAQQTERIINAMKNRYTTIISHPTGREINERPGYQLDFEKVFKAAKENNVAMEINSFPARLDLNDVNARAAKDFGVMLSIGTDAHQIGQLSLMEYGVSVARRAWCEKKDIINTLSVEQLLKRIRR